MGFVTGLENATVFKINNRIFRHDFNLGQWIQAAWAQAKFFQQGSPIVIEEVTGDCIIVNGNLDKTLNINPNSVYYITQSSKLTTENWNNAYIYGYSSSSQYNNIMIINEKAFTDGYSLVYKVDSGNELRFLYNKDNVFTKKYPAIPVYDSNNIVAFTKDSKDYIYSIFIQEFDKISGSIYNKKHSICIKIKFSTSEGYMMEGWLNLGCLTNTFGGLTVPFKINGYNLATCVSEYSFNWACSQANGSINPLTDDTDYLAFTRNHSGSYIYTTSNTSNLYGDIISRNPNFIKDFLNCFNIPFADYDNRNVQTDDLTDGWLGPGEPISPDSPNPPPYNPGGDSEQGGGTGDFDDSSDNIDVPVLPPNIADSTSLFTLYKPSKLQLQYFAEVLYSPNFIQAITNSIWGSPDEAVISLGIAPLNITTTGTGSIKIGTYDTGLIFPIIDNQFVTVDCGSIQIKEYWGNFMDYSPYTKIDLFLPFIGMISLSSDEVMDSTISIKYICDLFTGTCQAFIRNDTRQMIIATYTGNLITHLPLSSTDYSRTVQTLATAITGATLAATTGGVSALATSAISSVSNITSAKPTIQRTGGMSASGALLGYKKPYVIITRPSQSIPLNYNKFRGYPSNITSKLGDLKGYTEVEYVHLEGFNTATDTERTMIENQLKAGIIL